MLQKISVEKKVFFSDFYSSQNPGKISQFPEKNYAVFNIDNNKKCFLNTN